MLPTTYKVYTGAQQLPPEKLLEGNFVDIKGEPLSLMAKLLIWTHAVDTAEDDADQVIEEYDLTSNKDQATYVVTTKAQVRRDWKDTCDSMPDSAAEYGSFDVYWDSFPFKLPLPDGKFVIWME